MKKSTTDTATQTDEAHISKILTHKHKIYEFLTNLVGIAISDKVLVDIMINQNDPQENLVLIEGRPKVSGSSSKQMRHVTPYSFIKNAITTQVKEKKEADFQLITDLVDKVMTILLPIHQAGISLTENQYSDLQKEFKDQSNRNFYDIKMTTSNNDGTQNIYYLISDTEIIDKCKSTILKIPEHSVAQSLYKDKFKKYIDFGFKYLKTNIDNQEMPILTTCEGISRLILTIFNQDKGASFPEEGNSLLEEIRLYNEDAKNHKDQYNINSHMEICQKITIDLQNFKQADKVTIRIVDNEGAIVKNAAKALSTIDLLLGSANTKLTTEINEYIQEYNSKFNSKIIVNIATKNDYEKDFDEANYKDIIPHHVAKHLYSVFDFKPLETNVLVPKQKGDKDIIKVYPSATGIKTAEYSIQNGVEYRELQYNARKGYNDDTVFRLKMNVDDTKELLAQKIITHTLICLIPYSSLMTSIINESNEDILILNQIFKSLVSLVKADYASSTITLNDKWVDNLTHDFEKSTADFMGIGNTSHVSSEVIESYSEVLGKIEDVADLNF